MSKDTHLYVIQEQTTALKLQLQESKINTLMTAGIPVFFPTGNSRDYTKIDWPACIPASIAIGATMPAGL
ncbi:MAG UNVERIFIED_CONTAM: hypothetical protein LVQ98_09240 [Rickettsiaceae bacterium]